MKINFSILLLALSLQVFGQSYPITTTITIPPNPDASLTKMGAGTLILTGTAKMVNSRIDPRVESSKILVTIKKGGSKICGSYTSSSAPSANFTSPTKVWSGNNAASLLGQECTLSPGDYELCVQFFGQGPTGLAPLSEEKCKSFTIREAEQQNYQQPQALSPANGTVLAETDLKKPITFRWTPVVPRPRESVTYRIKVWQRIAGQSGMQAMQVNQPIITRDVDNLTQTIITNLLNGPCKPPYLCDFVWNVQALNREGKPIGGNNGSSESLRFYANSCDANLALKLISVECLSSADGNTKYRVCVSSTYTSSVYNLTYSNAGSGFKAYHPSYSPVYTVSNITPALQVQNSGLPTTVIYCFDLSVPTGQTAVKIGLQGDDKDPGPIVCQPGAELDVRLSNCIPPSCDCGTWGSLYVQNAAATQRFECGKEIEGSCNKKFDFRSSYQCAPNDNTCVAKTKWTVSKGGVTIGAGSGLVGSFTPTANGVYTITLNADCNGKACPPCIYTVVVRDCKATPFNSSICGIKFNDLNGNGIQDKEEPGIVGWVINLTGLIDLSTKTDEKGNYCFTDLKPGQYTVKEAILPGWQQTAPTQGHYQIKIQNGQNVTQINFGNRFDVCPSGTKVWSPLGTGVNGKLYAIAHIGTDIYVGGEFTMAGGVPANNIAKWNGSTWSALGQGLTGIFSKVNAILAVGTDLYVGGTFSLAGGVSANCIAKWDGYNWTALGAGISGNGNGIWHVEEIRMIGNNLYAGGLFNLAGGISAKNIAKWNGTSWSALAGGFSGVVLSIAEFNGMVYAGGISGNSGGNNSTSSLYKWNGTSWSLAIPWSLTPTVCDLLVVGPNLYVGGFFTQPWGTNRIAKWDGTTWSSVGTGTNGHIDALVTIGNDIYSGGAFTTAGGTNHSSVAKWNGTNWSGLYGGIAGHVWALTAVGADLYAAGNFLTAGGVSTNYVAKYSCKKDDYKTGKVNPELEKEEEKAKLNEPITVNSYHFISDDHTSGIIEASSNDKTEIIVAGDTLFLQIENNYSSGSNQFTYTIRNLSNNKTSQLTKLDIKNSQGLIRIALPIQNSVVGKGETGMLTLNDSKKYYYIRFKRN
ncbi:SdrD B-like domain-containing protein [Daejeonella sp.]|uniref:SdrD B-like domain-containing protein n=1 Tax=Daejeonella sp. TaxID=2805397 RepID=UPI0030C52E5E